MISGHIHFNLDLDVLAPKLFVSFACFRNQSHDFYVSDCFSVDVHGSRLTLDANASRLEFPLEYHLLLQHQCFVCSLPVQ